MVNQGHYGYLHIEDKQVGGFLHWTQSKKDNCYCTNNWWLFEDIRKCALTLFVYKNGALKKVKEYDLVGIIAKHNVILNCELKGTLKVKGLIERC